MKHPLRRIRQILEYSKKAADPLAAFNLAVLGFARGHALSNRGFLGALGRTLYPQLIVRPRLFCGLKLHLDPADVSHLVVAEEFLVDNIYDLACVPFVPDTVVDCGAHIGMFVLQAACRFPQARMVAFEPNPDNLPWLRKQVDQNHLDVSIVEAAVTTEDGESPFAASHSHAGTLVRDGAARRGSVVVRTVRLADYIAGLASRRFVLKMDVEGEEMALLPDIVDRLPQESAIFLETHQGDASWHEAARLLGAHGFAVTQTRRRQRFTDGRAIRV